MANECQAQNAALPAESKKRRIFGRSVSIRVSDPKFVEEVLRRRSNGESADNIAKEMSCHRNTVMKVIQREGDPLGKVESILRNGMPRIADMVIQQTLAKKDVRAGVSLLQGAGQLDLLKPKPAADDGGRIVIEWSGAPPPWAPAPVLKAYAERAIAPPSIIEPKRDDNVQDAEVVREDTSAENSQTGQ